MGGTPVGEYASLLRIQVSNRCTASGQHFRQGPGLKVSSAHVHVGVLLSLATKSQFLAAVLHVKK
jgi:hypothetical protein